MNNSDDPEAIKAWARVHALCLDGGKIIVFKALAADLRKIGAWDDESMLEQKDLPMQGGSRC